jgi:aquaporin Z
MNALRRHYPEYLIEAVGLGSVMISAVLITIAVQHPISPIRQMISAPLLRRFIIGVGVGLNAIVLIYSPWGKQSGAHFNPVITLTFFRLGKVKPKDAFFYIISQFLGGCLGISLAIFFLKPTIADPSVQYIATVPGINGEIVAFFAEAAISFGLMITVLIVSNTIKLARFTGVFVGILVATYITIEAPLSGMSMNPARTFASAISAHNWTAIWIYFTAPLLGMFLAAELYVRVNGRKAVRCAKLHHQNNKRCIFRCGYREAGMKGQPLLSDQLPMP